MNDTLLFVELYTKIKNNGTNILKKQFNDEANESLLLHIWYIL
jgi:hypothetical protein